MQEEFDGDPTVLLSNYDTSTILCSMQVQKVWEYVIIELIPANIQNSY